ncbi:MAG: hypothetical protein KIT83_21060 [Bryobacterales bacterium]|nr:hypothetical protein [Bryobacterales bacterium]
MKKPVLVGVLLLAGIVGLIVWSSLGLREHRVEVCMTFEGKNVCRVAQGGSKEAAQRQALDNACAMLTSGVTGTISCMQTPPDSVRYLND